MTDIEFLVQLKERLQNYEQILIRADVKQIESATIEIQSFLSYIKNNPPKPSGADLRPITESIKQLLDRNKALIQEGMNFNNTMMLMYLNDKKSTTSIYRNPRISSASATGKLPPTQRIFDASV